MLKAAQSTGRIGESMFFKIEEWLEESTSSLQSDRMFATPGVSSNDIEALAKAA